MPAGNRDSDDRYVSLSGKFYRWYDSARGRSLQACESALLSRFIPDYKGALLCSAGFIASPEVTAACSCTGMRHIHLDTFGEGGQLRGSIHHWPVRPGIFDAVVLHHAQEWSRRPQHIIREACRAVRPGGQLIVLGFNPLSLSGLYRFFRSGRFPVPYGTTFFSASVIQQWLSDEGFSCDPPLHALRTAPLKFKLPRNTARKRKSRFHIRLPFGGIFVLRAVRKQNALIPGSVMWDAESRPESAQTAPARACGKTGSARPV